MTSARSLAVAGAVALLVAAGGCATVRDPERIGSYVDDATITTRIKADMVADKNLDAGAIRVDTVDGTVMLSGFAKTPLEKVTAESIAIKALGVKQVRNEIAVRS